MAGRARASGDQKRPRRVLVEPVHELGPIALASQSGEQPVEMLGCLGPPLGGEPRRLVQHERERILVDYHVADELLLVFGQQLAFRLWPRRSRRRAVERRHADLLPCLDAVSRHRALAREPQLTGTGPARDDVEADVGQMPLEPPVEADAVVIFADCEGADVVHERALSES